MSDHVESRPVTGVRDPRAESDVAYLVVDADTLRPDIREVRKGTTGSFPTLQEAKGHAMAGLREQIDVALASLERLRFLGVEPPRLDLDSDDPDEERSP